MRNIKLGKYGEEKAEEFLKKNGYRIIEKNFRTKFGEIDIIAKNKKHIVFIEVKTRSSLDFGYPEESVSRRKFNRIKKCAEIYLLRKRKEKIPVRFEILSILKSKEKLSFKILPAE